MAFRSWKCAQISSFCARICGLRLQKILLARKTFSNAHGELRTSPDMASSNGRNDQISGPRGEYRSRGDTSKGFVAQPAPVESVLLAIQLVIGLVAREEH